MKRGVLVYSREDAPQNSRFIFRACESAKKRSLSLELCYTDELEASLPGLDFAILRTRRPKMHEIVEAAGLRCLNSARLNAVANDKLLCYDMLHYRVPMLTSFDALLYKAPPFLPCVVKPAGGHGGQNVTLAYDEAEYTAAVTRLAEFHPLVQPFADPGRDKRVYVIGGSVKLAMLRSSAVDFRSNYKLGGKAEAVPLSADELDIVRAVQAALPIDYAGVDIIYDKGRPVLNELEDPVGARMVYENSNVDIIDEFIEYAASIL